MCVVAATRLFPRARWIVALHHHLMEYPMPVTDFSERIGTALIIAFDPLIACLFSSRLRAKLIVPQAGKSSVGIKPLGNKCDSDISRSCGDQTDARNNLGRVKVDQLNFQQETSACEKRDKT